jgi:protein arginine N-methyltransferase 5
MLSRLLYPALPYVTLCCAVHDAFRYFELSPPQPVFTFTHPNWQQPADNSRAISLTFNRPAEQGSGVLHGFAGYFESVLYGGKGAGVDRIKGAVSVFC